MILKSRLHKKLKTPQKSFFLYLCRCHSISVLVHCNAETIMTKKGMIKWPVTSGGKNATQPCPKNPHCYATRHWWALRQFVHSYVQVQCLWYMEETCQGSKNKQTKPPAVKTILHSMLKIWYDLEEMLLSLFININWIFLIVGPLIAKKKQTRWTFSSI